MTEKEKMVYDLLKKNQLYADAVYTYQNLIAVEINWGDWKHEHARADWLIGENGGRLINEMVTEEDGSDCYSAVHYYAFN